MAGVTRESFGETVEAYRKQHDDGATSTEERRLDYATLVNRYYDLATDFYEMGWGQSFHFAPRFKHEAFKASLLRHERFLARKLRLAPGKKVLDIGCGVGGPMRNIARHTGAEILGINNNAYQIKRGERHNARQGLSHKCGFAKADFHHLPAEDASIDAVYTIEASCHAPDRVKLFTEIARTMKPGALFGGYEWCLTGKYDKADAEHVRIKKEIEEGNGLPDMAFTWEIDEALKASGFEVVETVDLAPTGDPETPWYRALTGEDMSLAALPRTPLGREITNKLPWVLEKVGVAPKGTQQVSDFLNAGADSLVEGGRREIFTPMYFFLAKKIG